MKHCVIITAYKDVCQINKLIEAIPLEWGIFLHLDKKSDISICEINHRAHSYKLKNIYWGGREHVEAILDMLRIAYLQEKSYDFYHIITGQDYFSSPPIKFDDILGHEGYSYMECFQITDNMEWMGYDILRYRQLSSYCNIRRKIPHFCNKIVKGLQIVLNRKREIPQYPIYGGSVYCDLTREAVKEILTNPITSDLLDRIKDSWSGEEIFFQTILMNSKQKDKIIARRLRYIDWPGPKILTSKDYCDIISSKTLFCRKLDLEKSWELYDQLESFIKNEGESIL